ncbi:hypothetical protein B0H63DRAFT_459280 [Podospora didyma]|uniref:PPP4R2-domain-containing protein n=1 Tax=Podospora didyma TaxID=330526 RepID=A0AAE0P5P0_9PEZI|nr:hypothetical protein B0H63DRAFT_459280 [Podospora didyma]
MMAEMEIETDDDILKKVAQDGSMDYSLWPGLLPALVSRIEKIVHHEFPIPHLPPPNLPVRPPSPRFLAPLPSSDPIDAPDSSDAALSSDETNKENANPSSVLQVTRPSAPPPPSSAPSSEPTTTAQQERQPGTLPAPIIALLEEITSTLTLNFTEYPPHTIQRLAELVLCPRQHYRHLAAYLHALDRVVHVTSGANIYPLPPAIPDMSAMSLLANGVGGAGAGRLTINTAAANNIGSDEALGGALLTPIPWLTRRANGGDSQDSSETGGSSPLSSGPSAAGPAAPPQQPQTVSPVQPQQQQPQRSAGGAASSSASARALEGQVRTESTETIEGPNGMGSIETVSVSVNGIPSMGAGAVLAQRGVTQGELLRQEQRAGVVPLSQLARQQQERAAVVAANAGPSAATSSSAAAEAAADEDAPMHEGDAADEDEEEEGVPHMQGPEDLGAADMGPQSASTSSVGPGGAVEMHGIDVEAAVGRRLQSPPPAQLQRTASLSPEATMIPRSPKREATDELVPPSASKKRLKEDQSGAEQSAAAPAAEEGEEPMKDAEGDLVIVDNAQTDGAAADTTSPAAAAKDTPADSEPKSSSPKKLDNGDEDQDMDSTTAEDTTAAAAKKEQGNKESI